MHPGPKWPKHFITSKFHRSAAKGRYFPGVVIGGPACFTASS